MNSNDFIRKIPANVANLLIRKNTEEFFYNSYITHDGLIRFST